MKAAFLKNTFSLSISISLLIGQMLSSCGGGTSGSIQDQDSGGNGRDAQAGDGAASDADADVDGDVDADSDTDTDTDADTDTDSDMDSDTDSDGDTDSDSGADAGADADADGDADTDADADGDADGGLSLRYSSVSLASAGSCGNVSYQLDFTVEWTRSTRLEGGGYVLQVEPLRVP